tara:strand:- start:2253 stop:2873 length:621 start_codon:yes stop_codon:yes gene_type:complete
MINVYCVKWGTKYDRSFVEKLKSSVAKHLTVPHRFTCLTDKPEMDYDEGLEYPELSGVWHKLSLFEKVGINNKCLYFDLDIEINGNIDFLVWNEEDFEKLTLINSMNWKALKSDDRFRYRNNTLINSSIMRWSNSYDIFEKFMEKRDLYLRLYTGIDRFIFNERNRLSIKYRTFKTEEISSWQEDIKTNTIMIYNGKYNDIRQEND